MAASTTSAAATGGAGTERTMADAEDCLQQLISKDKEALIHSVQTRHLVVKEVSHYLQRLKLDLSSLSVIHVAGTKGKGSTCAFTESILRAYGLRTGLYTSPHLIHVTERFAVNGVPVTDAQFLASFFHCWDGLHATKHLAGDNPPLPSYFRFLTIVGFHLFVSQKVDVLVLEVGMGGRLDATNIVDAPIVQVTGVSPVGYDHMEVLGSTLTLIGREKGGILKPQVPAYAAVQPPEAMTALQQCAQESGIDITVVPPLEADAKGQRPALGLDGAHQQQNAALACALAHRWLLLNAHKHKQTIASATSAAASTATAAAAAAVIPAALDPHNLPAPFLAGLAGCSWPGRCQIIRDLHTLPAPAADAGDAAGAAPVGWSDRVTFYLDGAHTDASILVCLQWFAAAVARDNAAEAARDAAAGVTATEYVLLFNCGHTRDPFELLAPVLELYKPHVHAALQPTAATATTAMAAAASATTKPVAAPSGSSDAKAATAAAALAPAASIAFRQLVFAPFDSDRPHLQAIPSLDKLCATHTVAPPAWLAAPLAGPLAVGGGDKKLATAAAAAATAVTAAAGAVGVASKAGPGGVVAPWQFTLCGVWDSLLYGRHAKSAAAAAASTAATVATAAGTSAATTATAAAVSAGVYPAHQCVVQPNVSAALAHIRRLAHANPTVRYRVLATGSLYLVGNVLKHLNWKRG